jgi:hypothetical protein
MSLLPYFRYIFLKRPLILGVSFLIVAGIATFHALPCTAVGNCAIKVVDGPSFNL